MRKIGQFKNKCSFQIDKNIHMDVDACGLCIGNGHDFPIQYFIIVQLFSR